MSKAGYSAPSGAAVALVAATAKTVIGVVAPAQFGVDFLGYEIALDGATSTAIPPTVEICYCTFATNPPGTSSTTITPQQIYGRAITAGFTAAYNWTAEPTVLTPIATFTEPAFNGLLVQRFAIGQTPDSAVSNGFAIRITAAAAVNVRPTVYFERC
jgi:hypothetical protein